MLFRSVSQSRYTILRGIIGVVSWALDKMMVIMNGRPIHSGYDPLGPVQGTHLLDLRPRYDRTSSSSQMRDIL